MPPEFRFGLDSNNGPDNLTLLLRRAQDEISRWRKEVQDDIEKWCSSNGYTPVQSEKALALIDELKTRGVKSFEGLGIKVTL